MRHQQGASYIAILFAIMGFAFLAKIAIAVWEPYFDDRLVDSQIEELLKTAPANITPEKFNSELSKRLEMNNIRDFDIKQNVILDNAQAMVVRKNYEVRKNFLMNIDLVMKFEKEFDQSTVKAK
ncbi:MULTISPECIES: DUF4845 domain-containing protein [Acinetobacter]|uniref:DUF4845 domain-containing protein n=1 Tax=Acinetobacter TaxID=469 RepID=UPI000972C8F4|nr:MULTISPECIES: DUF4845 domain-containing protein [Acinetobacter]APX63292.1 hypothetical protein AsACE_CH01900 [Acinetobacter schindleri]POU22713.1 DUF4845 domain-containing protein [Acinetobacter sp. ACNIH3]POV78635.1 DUF4845 domain-containing protein [Acinetobacter sp. ACNIH4]